MREAVDFRTWVFEKRCCGGAAIRDDGLPLLIALFAGIRRPVMMPAMMLVMMSDGTFPHSVQKGVQSRLIQFSGSKQSDR